MRPGLVKRNRKWLKFAVPGALLAGALGYLLFSGVKKSMVYYLTLSELAEKGPSIEGSAVRLAGKVKEGSVRLPTDGGPMTFLLTDGTRDLPVSFSGIVPETFQEKGEVLVEGTWRAEPVFPASNLIPKCPSKYETRLEEKEAKAP